jgi:hypothetical protein
VPAKKKRFETIKSARLKKTQTKRVIEALSLHFKHSLYGRMANNQRQHQDVLLPISALEILLPLPTLLTLAALANPALSS